MSWTVSSVDEHHVGEFHVLYVGRITSTHICLIHILRIRLLLWMLHALPRYHWYLSGLLLITLYHGLAYLCIVYPLSIKNSSYHNSLIDTMEQIYENNSARWHWNRQSENVATCALIRDISNMISVANMTFRIRTTMYISLTAPLRFLWYDSIYLLHLCRLILCPWRDGHPPLVIHHIFKSLPYSL